MQSLRAVLVTLTALIAIVLGPIQSTVSPSNNVPRGPINSTTVTDMGQQPTVWLCHWMPYLAYICCCERRR